MNRLAKFIINDYDLEYIKLKFNKKWVEECFYNWVYIYNLDLNDWDFEIETTTARQQIFKWIICFDEMIEKKNELEELKNNLDFMELED